MFNKKKKMKEPTPVGMWRTWRKSDLQDTILKICTTSTDTIKIPTTNIVDIESAKDGYIVIETKLNKYAVKESAITLFAIYRLSNIFVEHSEK